MDRRTHPIRIRLRLGTDAASAWRAWTDPTELEAWLTTKATVEPCEGGKYELFWEPSTPDRNSTLGCKILRYDEPSTLAFQWRGPPQYADLMNTLPYSTCVVVSFKDSDAGCELDFEHQGWGRSDDWDAARSWQERAWRAAFASLESRYPPTHE